MRPLREWSAVRVALVCVGWILLWIGAIVGWLFVTIAGSMPSDTGSGGLGAVSFGISEAVIWLLFAPIPVVLIAWFISRLRSKGQPFTGP